MAKEKIKQEKGIWNVGRLKYGSGLGNPLWEWLLNERDEESEEATYLSGKKGHSK